MTRTAPWSKDTPASVAADVQARNAIAIHVGATGVPAATVTGEFAQEATTAYGEVTHLVPGACHIRLTGRARTSSSSAACRSSARGHPSQR